MVAPLPSSAACWAATPSWPFRPSAIDLPQKEVVRAAKPLANSALMDFLIFTYLYRFYSNWCEFPIAYLVHFLALQPHPNEIRWDPLNQLQWSRAANILESSSVESSKFKPPVTCRPSLANTHSLVGFKLPLRSPTKTSKLRELWQSRAKETTWKNLSLSVCHESKLYAICYIYIYTYTWCTHLSIYLSICLWQARLQRRPIPGLDLWIGRKSVGHSCRCLSSRGTAMGKHAKVNGKGDERRKSSQITIVLSAGSLDQLNLDEFWSVCSKTQNLCL